MCEVRLSGIRKVYEGARAARPAVDRLDLTFASGELVVLVGPSGCGKSTTLRIVAGLEDPTEGHVMIDGRDVTAMPPAQRDIAMVFQSYALYPHMSVFENLAFALRIRKLPEAEIKARVEEVAKSLAIDAYLDRRPKALSGGQRQRVAIGRAVVRHPKVFLFDEPLSNLDAKLRADMRREIARLHRESQTTSLYVTHDQIEAMTLADRIVVLKDGTLQQVGSPLEIYQRPANRFVAGFFGTPGMNFLPGDVVRRPDGRSDVVLGIRPEDIGLDRRAEGVRADTDPLASAKPGRVPLPGSVQLREVLGAEVVLHVASQAGEVTVRADARTAGRPGDNVTLWLDPEAVHWFDARSEHRLAS